LSPPINTASQAAENPLDSLSTVHYVMTSRSFGSSPRLYRHQEEGSLSLQPLPRSIPIRPHEPTHSSHQRSPSPSRFPRFEESTLSEKSRSDGVDQASPTKAEASTTRAPVPDSLSFHHQSSAPSLRHLTSHQGCATPDYLLSQIPDTASSHLALPLPSLHSGYLHPPRKIRLWSIVKPWLPVLAYLSTSIGFLVAIAFWKTQVFEGARYNPVIPALDAISVHLPFIYSVWICAVALLTFICLRL
jgi:hypothetical protein